MSDVAMVIADLIRAGVDPELIGRTAAAFAAQAPTPKTARQERNARYYRNKTSEKRLNSDAQDVSDGDAGLPSPEGSFPGPLSPKPLSPKPQSSIPPSPPKGGSSPAGFAEFWAIFPNKVGKRDAEHAFVKAVRRAELETILTGVRRYAAKTDDRPWCNPATFLNQDRWADQPADVAPQPRAHAPPPKRTMNDALDDIINGKQPNEPGPTIDASFERSDRGSPQGVIQFDAFASRGRP